MKLIIDIPEEKDFIDKALWGGIDTFDIDDLVIVLDAIAHGIPLDVKSENMRMIKEKILHHFQDINFYYNDCMMYADLSGMLDELIAESEDKE